PDLGMGHRRRPMRARSRGRLRARSGWRVVPLQPRPVAAESGFLRAGRSFAALAGLGGMSASRIGELLAIMSRLRDPERGCPWDLEQDFSTIAPYTTEEAYEVADAIARNDMVDLR